MCFSDYQVFENLVILIEELIEPESAVLILDKNLKNVVERGQGVGGLLERERIFYCSESSGDDVGNYEVFIIDYMLPEWWS